MKLCFCFIFVFESNTPTRGYPQVPPGTKGQGVPVPVLSISIYILQALQQNKLAKLFGKKTQ
ncbi:hypothetical protein BpHYR1_038597 [Brachionus plicatilis]|uniref:Uncharacterized protein n=1 Tax=Brachionus plicatilis TaxID=10195 RepID=A0A3M7PNW1_BRAPC|nr:hypothetical protein BpHYR1_038597 [Brachionus plicatilis]